MEKDRIINKESIPYKLNEAMIRSINAAEEDIKCGRVFTHEEVMKEMKEWLKEK